MPDPGEGEWIELRVHGVSGTPPESMLASAHAHQVAGDDRSRFFRPTDAQGNEVRGTDGQIVEAFHWGRWTSGSWVQALWILLIPFGIVNAAQFMLSPPGNSLGARRFHAVCGALLRLLALVLTSLFGVGVCVVVMDLVAWQWLARMDLPGDDRVIMVTAVLVTAGVVYLLARLGQGSEARRAWATPEEADGLPGMRDPAFFDGDRDSPALRHLHRGAPLFLIAWLAVSVVVESREGLAVLGRWAPVIGLLVTVVVTVLLGDPERSTTVAMGAGALRRWWHGISPTGAAPSVPSASEQVAAGLHLVALVFVLGGAAAIGFAPVSSTGALPGVGAPLPGIEEVAAWVGIGGTLALLLLGGAVAGLARWTRAEAEPVPAPFQRFARGMTAWLACAIGFFIGIGLTAGLALTVQGILNRVRGNLDPVQAPDILQRVSFTWGVTAGVLVLLAGVAWWYVRRRRAPFLAAATAAFTFGADEYPRLPAVWLGRVGHGMQLARLKNHLPLVFWIFGVLGVVLALAAATDHLVERFTDGADNPVLTVVDWFTGTSSLAGAPIVGDDIVIGIGQFTLLGLAGGAVLLARGAIRAEGPRRALNVVWDVIAFWPRSVHPFVPPPYAQEVVPALIRRICWHLGRPDPLPDVSARPGATASGSTSPVRTVVVAAHSQGSLVSFAALLRLPADVRPRVKWLTCGSQLRQQFPRAFPHYVRVPDLEEMLTAHSWLSLYRDTDPIAGPVTSWDHACQDELPVSCRLGDGPRPVRDEIDEDTGRRICGREWRLLDPPVSDRRFQFSPVARLRGHSDYWLDRDWGEALRNVLADTMDWRETPAVVCSHRDERAETAHFGWAAERAGADVHASGATASGGVGADAEISASTWSEAPWPTQEAGNLRSRRGVEGYVPFASLGQRLGTGSALGRFSRATPPAQRVFVLAAGLLPVVVTGALLGAVSGPAPAGAPQLPSVSIGLLAAWVTALLLLAALYWCLIPVMVAVASSFTDRRGRLRRVLIAELERRSREFDRAPALPSVRPSGVASPTAAVAAERRIIIREGFSVSALWGDARPFLSTDDRRAALLLDRQNAAYRATAAGAAVSGLALAIAPLLATLYTPEDGRFVELFIALLSGTLVLYAAGSLLRANGAVTRILEWQAELIKRKSPEILTAYSYPVAVAPMARSDQLHDLSLALLQNRAGLPSAPGGFAGATRALDVQVQRSLREALRRPVVVNVEGRIAADVRHLGDDVIEITVEVITGPNGGPWKPTSSKFQQSGGEYRPVAALEISVDAPGLHVDPSRHRSDVDTHRGRWSCSSVVSGSELADADIWLTLYASGRYVTAVRVTSRGDQSVTEE